MPSFNCVKSVKVVRSPRVMQLEGMFDIAPTRQSQETWTAELPFEKRDWQIGLIVGPSGCGKSTVARELFADAMIDGFDWPKDKSIVDGFPKGVSIRDITQALSSVGFSSPPSWLRPFRVLSNGEQFRTTIARALMENPELACIDEFTSVVDRQVAKIGSAAIAKAVRRGSGKFVAVSCHYDIADWLSPDWMFEPATGAFTWKEAAGNGRPFRRPPIRLQISRVHRKAWQLFHRHHYLSSTLSKTARCFIGTIDGTPATFTAVVNFPHPTASAWREHRTVCLPDFQGVGLGNAMSEFVASVFAGTGRNYISTTGNPAMIRHRARSKKWTMHRKPGLASAPSLKHRKDPKDLNIAKSASWDRITAGFRYVGPPADPETVAGFLN